MGWGRANTHAAIFIKISYIVICYGTAELTSVGIWGGHSGGWGVYNCIIGGINI